MMPLIDVIFLLLTFFIYSMVLMVRVYLLPVQLPGLSQGETGQTDVRIVSITIDGEGQLFLDAEVRPDMQSLIRDVRGIEQEDPEAQFYVAPDMQGSTDRLPVFVHLINQLRNSGIDEFYIVGQPVESNLTPTRSSLPDLPSSSSSSPPPSQ